MKRLIISALAATSLAAAVTPALAQPYGGRPGGPDRGGVAYNINARQAQIESRIEQGVRNRSLTRNEAFRLRSEMRQIKSLEAQYRRGGLNNWERRDLDRRLDSLSARVFVNRHDNQHRYR